MLSGIDETQINQGKDGAQRTIWCFGIHAVWDSSSGGCLLCMEQLLLHRILQNHVLLCARSETRPRGAVGQAEAAGICDGGTAHWAQQGDWNPGTVFILEIEIQVQCLFWRLKYRYSVCSRDWNTGTVFIPEIEIQVQCLFWRLKYRYSVCFGD